MKNKIILGYKDVQIINNKIVESDLFSFETQDEYETMKIEKVNNYLWREV